jgi:hypothetical protein
MPNKETLSPLFRFSRYVKLNAILALSFLLFALIPARVDATQLALTIAGLSFLLSIFFAISLVEYFRSIRDAKFYEDHFTVRGWKVNRRIEYGVIEAVVKHPTTWVPMLRIFVKGDAKPLVIPRIPKSGRLQTDLYSWLSTKVLKLRAQSSIIVDTQAEPLSSEELLCIVSSPSLTRDGEGYSLVVTRTRIIGSNKLALGYGVYLGPESQATTVERKTAYEIAQEVFKTNDLGLSRDSIVQIGYQAPGTVSVGRIIVRTLTRDYVFNLGTLASDGAFKPVLSCLLRALIEFAPNIIRDEKSGDHVTTANL